MKQLVFFAAVFFAAVIPFHAKAQPDSMLNVYANDFREERIYIHFDRSAYLPGETIWFKAYLMAGIEPSDISKSFYADFAAPDGRVLFHISAPIAAGVAAGRFDIPSGYTFSTLRVCAYTKWMLNFDSAFLYNKNITIVQQQVPVIKKRPTITLSFFPEGGDLVNGLQSIVAFKAVNQFGSPVKVKGGIYTASGTFVDSFASKHDGMGSFFFQPQKNEKYTAKWSDEWGDSHTTLIPLAKENGAVLRVMSDNKNKKVYALIVRSDSASDNFKEMNLVATMHKQMVYRSKVRLGSTTSAEGKIPIEQLPAGILQITLFDADWKPQAERICFVKNNMRIDAKLNVTRQNFAQKGKNSIEIDVIDSLPANYSVAVTDADANGSNPENIISSLLLTSDIKGYVTNPSYYFNADADSVNQYLDYVMMTNGWRRFNWSDVLQKRIPHINYPKDTAYLSLTGKVLGVTPAQIRNAGDLTVIMKFKNTVNRIYQYPIKPNGNFGQKDFVFYDTVSFYYQFNKDRELSDAAVVTFSNGLLSMPYRLKIDSAGFYAQFDTSGYQRARQLYAYQQSLERLLKGVNMPGVTVTAKAKRPIELLDDKYASGLFSGGDGIQFDVMNDFTAKSALSVFAYLQGRVAGLSISEADGSNPSVKWRNSNTSLFLDEMPVDAATLQGISMNDVAYVKAMRPPFLGAIGGGDGGAILVYTRKGNDRPVDATSKGLDKKMFVGYTYMKEFYSPNYERNPDQQNNTDMRTTLYWNPALFTNNDRQTIKIEFFNNDITKKFRIDIQGVDSDGRLISIEKIIKQQ